MRGIGLDVGGTKIAAVAVDEKWRVVAEKSAPTPNDYQSFLAVCCELAAAVSQGQDEIPIGVGLPCRIDGSSGAILASANVPCLSGKTLRRDLENSLRRRVFTANDAGCMALAEAISGAGRGYSSVLGIIIGTGVGAGFVLRGELLEGRNGLMGEIGHLPLPFYDAKTDGEAAMCACGQRGCIESMASGGALARLYSHAAGCEADAAKVAALAANGDKTALAVLDRYYEVLAKAMVAAAHSFDPDAIVLGGGVSQMPRLCEEISRRWGRYIIGGDVSTALLAARHKSNSGAIGAAMLGVTP